MSRAEFTPGPWGLSRGGATEARAVVRYLRDMAPDTEVAEAMSAAVKEKKGGLEMNTEQPHTPTPWHIDDRKQYGRDAKGKILFVTYDGDEDEANAAFIVRAVNAHEDLIHAVENLLWKANQNQRLSNDDINMAAYALAKAKGAVRS